MHHSQTFSFFILPFLEIQQSLLHSLQAKQDPQFLLTILFSFDRVGVCIELQTPQWTGGRFDALAISFQRTIWKMFQKEKTNVLLHKLLIIQVFLCIFWSLQNPHCSLSYHSFFEIWIEWLWIVRSSSIRTIQFFSQSSMDGFLIGKRRFAWIQIDELNNKWYS